MSHAYEVEIKSLLGSRDKAMELVSKLKNHDGNLKLIGEERQLNHYFNVPEGVDISNLSKLIPDEKKESFDRVVKEGKKISVRTRESKKGLATKVIFVIKASVGDDSSSNGVKRIEFESEANIPLSELDQILLDAGLTYQAKWSREREEYSTNDLHICLDKNAGYGYLAEFEKVVSDESELENAKNEILSFMSLLGVEELAQDRLERMFAHYNQNWEQYYGTEKTFTIN